MEIFILTWFRIAETQCSSLARNDSGGPSQSQLDVVKRSNTSAHWDPNINGLFPRPAIEPTTQPSQNNDNHKHLKIPFDAENRDSKQNPEKDV